MRKYYTRACNFVYGNYAKNLIKNKEALPLTGNKNIAFNCIEIFERKKNNKIKNSYYSINEIKFLNIEKKNIIQSDIKKIISKRKNILGLNFKNPLIMGILNVTPDSFSDGGLFFQNSKAYNQAKKI